MVKSKGNNSGDVEGNTSDSADFIARDYQDVLLSIAIEENTILYLPTGAGKTFIAVMLIKSFSRDIEKPLSQDGKRAFFLVNTVALVGQQSQVIQRHTSFSVGRYSGDLNVDLWTKDRWLEELEDHSVIVMTSQILLNMLQHNYIKLENIRVIIFDECHRGVKDHPMRNIMRYFENVPTIHQPHVLGLTGSLLNATIKESQVTSYIREIETTFMSRIVTAKDSEMAQQINSFSTDPQEILIHYRQENIDYVPLFEKCKDIFKELKLFVKSVILTEEYQKPAKPNSTSVEMVDLSKLNKKVVNLIDDVWYQMTDLGLYGGFKASLAHIIQVERLKRNASNAAMNSVYQALITGFTCVRKLCADVIADHGLTEAILKFSSNKVLKFIDILKSVEKNDSVIVFVERRFTCKVIFYILQDLNKSEYLPNIIPDFIVGYNNNPFNDTREGLFEKKINKNVLRKFNEGKTNVLVASDVLEEGIDVQTCNLVIKFNPPKTARSYIQSKGRARNRDSKYYIFIDVNDSKFSDITYKGFKQLEERLRQELVGKSVVRSKPSQEELDNTIFNHSIEPFMPQGPGGPMITGAAAISLINRYCMSLHVDYFTNLTPFWWKEKFERSDYQFVVSLQLPNPSPVRETIKGKPYQSIELAKRSAAIEACKLLYEFKELDEYLLPRGRSSEQIDDSSMFPNWEDEVMDYNCSEDNDGEKNSKDETTIFLPGTKKRKQLYRKKYPECLSRCRPTSGNPVFMHIVHMKPNYERPVDSTRKAAFYDLFLLTNTYAVLSSKPLPKVAEFSLFMSTGEINITIAVNADQIMLTQKEINDVIDFHSLIFTDIVATVHSFMFRDFENLEQSFLFTPVKEVSNENGIKYKIDWDVIINNKSLPKIEPLCEQERRNIKVTDEHYKGRVIVPWYRGFAPRQAYIVTAVSEYENAYAPFPSDEFDDYVKYFTDKYSSKVNEIFSPDEMLLEVRAVSNKFNCLRPRGVSKGRSKRKRKEEEEFEETLVAELCVKYDVPAVYWLKATLIPSISHRLLYLMIAAELRTKITASLNEDIDVTDACYEAQEKLKPVEIDLMTIQEQEEEFNVPANSTAKVVTIKPKSSMPINEPLYPWGDEQEPIDFQRHIDQVKLLDIFFFDDFINKPLSVTTNNKLDDNNTLNLKDVIINSYCISVNNLALKQKLIRLKIFKCCNMCVDFGKRGKKISDGKDIIERELELMQLREQRIGRIPAKQRVFVPNEPAPPLMIFKKSSASTKVQQGHLIEALTAASAHDVYSLERLETLGDSFLKYSISLILYLTFPRLTEGQLTNIKGKIIGNRNLYYCGKKMELGSIVKVTEFNTECDWIAPGFCVDRKLQQVLQTVSVNPRFLYNFNLSKEEQVNGKLLQETLDMIEMKLLETTEETDVSNLLNSAAFLSQQLVTDKTISDCIESILGLYIQNCGLETGFHLLRYLGVTKKELIHENIYRKGPVCNLCFNNVSNIDFHLHLPDDLQQLIGYKFKDRSFLLQALSHPTYQPNNITPTYQRLEFLGDAILDFLITCHIFETCSSKLTPGELTDLRSALVNNITLAVITVRIGLHKFLLMRSCKLNEVIDNFVQRQLERKHQVDDQVLFLIEEDNISLAEAVEVPKVLGDVFESLVGAIFLDSGKCLETTWNFIYKFMKKEIELFSANVPKNHVRQLYEENVTVKFKRCHIIENFGRVMVPVTIVCNNQQKTFHGFGETKLQAKRAAAKLALRFIRSSHS